MEPNPVCWFEIYVQDMDRAKNFYEAVLEAKLEKLPAPDIEMWTFPMATDHAGSSGALVSAPGVDSGGNSVMVYFSCDDCAVEAGRVDKAGGKVRQEKMSIGEYGFIAHALDTEGNVFGLHSLK